MFLTFQNETNFLHTHTIMLCVPVIIATKKCHFALITGFVVKNSERAQKHVLALCHDVGDLIVEDSKARAVWVTTGIPWRWLHSQPGVGAASQIPSDGCPSLWPELLHSMVKSWSSQTFYVVAQSFKTVCPKVATQKLRGLFWPTANFVALLNLVFTLCHLVQPRFKEKGYGSLFSVPKNLVTWFKTSKVHSLDTNSTRLKLEVRGLII